MPAPLEKYETVLIQLFVSAYENCAWNGSRIDYLDQKKDGAPDALVTRADHRTIVIEHTLIEPFVSDKKDFAAFEPAFRAIKDDKSLAIPYTGITVYVPVGTLDGQKLAKRNLIVEAIHSWIANNRLDLREGRHTYQCEVPQMSPIALTVKRNKFGLPQGVVLLQRQQNLNDLDKVVERALGNKLTKLVETEADRHLLLLERDQFPLLPDQILTEIESQRSRFPLLEKVDEIWLVETVCYEKNSYMGYLDFELQKGDQTLATIAFHDGVLIGHSRNGVPYPM